MKKMVVVFLIASVFSACSGKQSSDEVPPVTSLYIDMENKIDFNQKIRDIQLIPLDTDDKGRFGSCTKIRIYKDKIYLYSFSDLSVYIFSEEGTFIKALNATSRPKLEFPSTIFMDRENDQLWIIEERSILMKYDLKGNFIEKETLPFLAVDLTKPDSKSILYFHAAFNKNIEYHLTKQDLTDKENLIHLLPFQSETEKKTYIPFSLFTETSDKSKTYMLLSDIIYVSDPSNNYQLSPLYKLDFGEELVLDKLFDKNKMSDKEVAEKLDSREYINNIQSFYLASDQIFMRFEGKYESYCGINLNTKEVFTFDYLFDKLNPYNAGATIMGAEKDRLYCLFKNRNLINHYKDHPISYKGIEEKISYLPDDPNGWTIAIIYLK